MQNSVTSIELNQGKRVSIVDFLFMLYITVINCYFTSAVVRVGFLVLMAFTLLRLLSWRDEKKIIVSPYTFILLNFVAYCYISKMWAWYPSLVDANILSLAAGVIMCFMMVNYFTKANSVDTILNTIVVSGIVIGIYIIISYGGLSAFYEAATVEDARVGSKVNNLNHIGMMSVYSIIVLLFFAMYKKKRFCYILSVIPFVILAASGSRGSLIMFVAAFFLLIYFKQITSRGATKLFKLIVWGVAGFIFLKLILNFEIFATVKDRMEGVFALFTGEHVENGGTSSRVDMIKFGIEQFKETPLFGIGHGNSYALNFYEKGYFSYLHNDYIEMLVNGGLVGFVLYYGVIITLFIKHIILIKKYKEPEIILSMILLITYIISSITIVNYYISVNPYMYMTLWISIVEIYKKRGRENIGKQIEESN